MCVFCVSVEDVRLVGGSKESEGRVEVLIHGVWGTVCNGDFDALDALVLCRMIGYRYANYYCSNLKLIMGK